MIIYKNKTFKDYIELSEYMIHVEGNLHRKWFLHSSLFYTRSLLKEIFPSKTFTMLEIQTILAEELALNTIKLYENKGVSDNASCC